MGLHCRRLPHRHIVVLPLFLAILLAVVTVSPMLSRASSASYPPERQLTLRSSDAQQSITLPEGILTLEPRADVLLSRPSGSLRLLRGDVHVDARSLLTLGASSVTVFAAYAQFTVTVDDFSTSIASVDAPLLLSIGGRMKVLPPGRQLRVGSAGAEQETGVPASWLQTVRASRRPLSNEDRESLRALMHHDRSEARLIAALTLLASGSAASSDVDLIATAFSDSDATSLLLTALPAVLRASPVRIPDGVIELWRGKALLFASADPATAKMLLGDIVDVPDRLTAADLPKQAALWRNAIDDVDAALGALLPDDSEQVAMPLAENDAVPSPDAPSTPEISPPPADELLLKTREMLLRFNALMGPGTSLTIDTGDPHAVRVTDFFVQEEGRDVRYEVVYTPETGNVSKITREGVRLPNSLPAAVFFGATPSM